MSELEPGMIDLSFDEAYWLINTLKAIVDDNAAERGGYMTTEELNATEWAEELESRVACRRNATDGKR